METEPKFQWIADGVIQADASSVPSRGAELVGGERMNPFNMDDSHSRTLSFLNEQAKTIF